MVFILLLEKSSIDYIIISLMALDNSKMLAAPVSSSHPTQPQMHKSREDKNPKSSEVNTLFHEFWPPFVRPLSFPWHKGGAERAWNEEAYATNELPSL